MPRLPQLTQKDQVPEAHRDVVDYLVKTRGRVSDGFSVLLNSPDLAGRIAHTGSYVRFESSLPREIHELSALTASTEIGNAYERGIHTRDLADLGVDEKLVQAVIRREPVDAFPAELTLPVRAGRELLRDKRLSPATFDEARQRLGDQGVVDLIADIGYYTMLGCLHVGLGVSEDAEKAAGA
jgi:4-carboxymuconolactone decarboxylase